MTQSKKKMEDLKIVAMQYKYHKHQITIQKKLT